MHSGRITSKESDCPLGLISLKLARNPFLKASYLGNPDNNQKIYFYGFNYVWIKVLGKNKTIFENRLEVLQKTAQKSGFLRVNFE